MIRKEPFKVQRTTAYNLLHRRPARNPAKPIACSVSFGQCELRGDTALTAWKVMEGRNSFDQLAVEHGTFPSGLC